eukprot:snap_masked-scaffold316_size209483-processed-gene-1.5 protein:Tk05937 transcript:snap_masked-scaffold316_size209483-processed-gene-1.5-mRNA-1 annotation:"udp-n-acetylglucosamine transferase subunit alg14 homolog"
MESGAILGVVVVCLIGLALAHAGFKSRGSKLTGQSPKIMIILGSGGHTTEMLQLLGRIPEDRYPERVFVLAATDDLSAARLRANQPQARVIHIARAREVGQSGLSTAFSCLWAVIQSWPLVLKERPDAILCNGPGTCLPVCVSAYLATRLTLMSTVIFYVESVCRVRSLSLSGRVMSHLTPHVLVQWPEMLNTAPRAQYIGRFV